MALRDVVLSLVRRHGAVPDETGEALAACDDAQRLRGVIVDLAGATDREAAIALVGSLRAPASSPR